MWKNISLSAKIIILTLTLIIFSVLTAVSYNTMSNQIRDMGIKFASDEMLSGYKNELNDIVNVMASTLAAATEGMENTDDIYKTYSKLTKGARFFPDQSGYFFIYKGSVNFVHAIKPELEGQDLASLKDANGTLLIQNLDKAAKSGGGFVTYFWDKPGKGNQPKLSYINMIPGSPYSIGTGIYIDDINDKEQSIFNVMNKYSESFLVKLLVVLSFAFCLVLLPLIIFMIKSITSPLIELTRIADEYSRGDLEGKVEFIDRHDEVGDLSRAIQRLGRSTKILMKQM